jgi:hypothetical protein
MLPIQYLRQAGARHMEPHKRLILAVLQTVVDDCQGSLSRRRTGQGAATNAQAYRDARAYVSSTDRSYAFSFENLCEAVGLDAGSLRRGLVNGVSHRQES